MKNALLLIGFSLLAILLNIIVSPWLAIKGIKPDFVLILLLFVSALKGRVIGQSYGFGIGLLVDIIGIGSFLGLSALTKTIAGFLSGNFKNSRSRINNFTFYGINIIIIFIHFAIFYLINYKSCDYSTQFILLRFVIPETIYTSVAFILIDYIFPLESY